MAVEGLGLMCGRFGYSVIMGKECNEVAEWGITCNTLFKIDEEIIASVIKQSAEGIPQHMRSATGSRHR